MTVEEGGGSEGVLSRSTFLIRSGQLQAVVWLPRQTAEFVPSPIEVLILEVKNAYSRLHSEFHWVRRIRNNYAFGI